jgi:hypothetical protein
MTVYSSGAALEADEIEDLRNRSRQNAVSITSSPSSSPKIEEPMHALPPRYTG